MKGGITHHHRAVVDDGAAGVRVAGRQIQCAGAVIIGQFAGSGNGARENDGRRGTVINAAGSSNAVAEGGGKRFHEQHQPVIGQAARAQQSVNGITVAESERPGIDRRGPGQRIGFPQGQRAGPLLDHCGRTADDVGHRLVERRRPDEGGPATGAHICRQLAVRRDVAHREGASLKIYGPRKGVGIQDGEGIGPRLDQSGGTGNVAAAHQGIVRVAGDQHDGRGHGGRNVNDGIGDSGIIKGYATTVGKDRRGKRGQPVDGSINVPEVGGAITGPTQQGGRVNHQFQLVSGN